MFKYFLLTRIKQYIFIILTATIFIIVCSNSRIYAKENIFIVDNVIVESSIDLNFSRENYINKGFKRSFSLLMNKVLISEDLKKISNIKLNEIQNLVKNFQVLEENYSKGKYKVTFKFVYNDIKVKKFLENKNISISQAENITSLFFPILFVNDELKNLNENYFYTEWKKNIIENQLINFILPIEDLDDVLNIKKMKNKIENLNVKDFVGKYDVENYAFALIDYNQKKLNIYLKINFDKNYISKNFTYALNSYDNKLKLNLILNNLKININDIWKELNVINLSMPLTINTKFTYKNLLALDKLKDTFYEINSITSYEIVGLDNKDSFFKVYYYGSPKKLKNALNKFGYKLENVKGNWVININD